MADFNCEEFDFEGPAVVTRSDLLASFHNSQSAEKMLSAAESAAGFIIGLASKNKPEHLRAEWYKEEMGKSMNEIRSRLFPEWEYFLTMPL